VRGPCSRPYTHKRDTVALFMDRYSLRCRSGCFVGWSRVAFGDPSLIELQWDFDVESRQRGKVVLVFDNREKETAETIASTALTIT
jgi:hypothetical protein